MSRLLNLYLKCLQVHPWKTQAASTGILMSTGDSIAQLFVEGKSLSEYDLIRTSRFFVFGTVISGPGLRLWYMLLERVKVGSRVTPAIRVALDQTFMAPTFLAVFLGGMSYVKTRDVEMIKAKFRQDYKSVLMNQYKIWPLAQLFNFYIVPFQHRILFVNVIAVFWNTYLAYKSEQAVQETPGTTELREVIEGNITP